MTIRELFIEIESTPFAAQLTVLSGFRSVQRALSELDAPRRLIEHVNQHPVERIHILERVRRLLSKETVTDVEHPDDIALATYLFVLNATDKTLADQAARLILKFPDLWWARRFAEAIEGHLETT